MYKLIKHTIEEQHFDHPALAEAAMKESKVYTAGITTPGMYHNSPAGVKLRMAARDYFSGYLWRLRSCITSIIDGGADQAMNETNFFNKIDDIGKLVAMYYGEAGGAEANRLFRLLSTDVFNIVKAVKANADAVPLKAKAIETVKALAKFLNGANPMYWPEQAIVDIFTQSVSSWHDEAVARHKKDYPAEQAAVANVYKLLLEGQASGTPGFADIMAKGIVEQFPDKFPY